MKLTDYIHGRGLVVSHVAKKMGVQRQQLNQYNGVTRNLMNLGTAQRIANAMTELGAPTTVADITSALMQKEE